MITDPVCGKRINRGKAHAVIEYEGVAYSLCCPQSQMELPTDNAVALGLN